MVILAGSHDMGPSDRRAGEGRSTHVVIGAGTWVGGRVTIVGPAAIGEGCMIAAGAIVRGEVPANSLYLDHDDIRQLNE